MIPLPITLVEYPEVLVSSKALHKRLTKAALDEALKFWIRKLFPKHFTQRAQSEYGYAERARSTKRSKAKRHGSRRPLVKTGQTMRMARNSWSLGGGSQVRGITRQVKFRVPIPRTDKRTSPKAITGNDIIRELTATTDQEERAIAIYVKDSYVELANKAIKSGARRKKVIK